jgi:dTDP-glucose 4,6-dehydratase
MPSYNFMLGYSLFEEDLNQVATILSAMPELRNAHIFLTGGTGFFGIWLTECLLYASQHNNLGLRITSLARNADKFYAKHPHLRNHDKLRLVSGDLEHFPPITESVTHIIHAATVSKLGAEDSWAFAHLNAAIDGTRNVLALAHANDARALLVSSGGVYRMPLDRPVDNRHGEEVDSLAAATSERIVYGLGKRTMEALAAAWAQKYGVRTSIARCFAFIGPWLPLDANFAAGNFMRDALHGGPILVGGDGTPLRSYLYPADLVIWLMTILLKGEAGVPYNVGGERAVTIAKLAIITAQEAGLPPESVHISGTPAPSAVPQSYLPDLKRAYNLGLSVHTELEEAVRKTLDWHKHREAYGHKQTRA